MLAMNMLYYFSFVYVKVTAYLILSLSLLLCSNETAPAQIVVDGPTVTVRQSGVSSELPRAQNYFLIPDNTVVHNVTAMARLIKRISPSQEFPSGAVVLSPIGIESLSASE